MTSGMGLAAGRTFETGIRALFLAAIALAVLPNGSIGETAYYLATILNAAVFALASCIAIRNEGTRRLFRLAVILIVAAIVYPLFQAFSFAGNPFASPVWQTAEDLVQPTYNAISVAPFATLAAIPALALPFCVFASAIVLHQGDHDARNLWRRLALFGGSLALIGLVRHFAFPEAALFGTPPPPRPDFVGNFYNRNNAAAFFVLSGFAVLGLILMQATRMEMESVRRRFQSLDFLSHRKYVLFGFYCLLLLACLTAVFLTRSRAGVGLSLVCFGIATAAIVLTARQGGAGLGRRLAVAIALIAAGAALFIVFGGQAITRADIDGFDETRWCMAGAILRAVQDNPVFGTGLGTFRDVFPIHRDAACGIHGVWDRAHNSYLEGWMGLGILFWPCLGIALFALVRALRAGFRDRRRFRFIPIIAGTALLYIGLHSVWDFPLQIPGISIYFAALMGAGCGIGLARRTQRRTG